MIVRCKIEDCGYNKDGDCYKKLLQIRENGTCAYILTKMGNVDKNAFLEVPNEMKEEIIMQEGEYHEIDINKEESTDTEIREEDIRIAEGAEEATDTDRKVD